MSVDAKHATRTHTLVKEPDGQGGIKRDMVGVGERPPCPEVVWCHSSAEGSGLELDAKTVERGHLVEKLHGIILLWVAVALVVVNKWSDFSETTNSKCVFVPIARRGATVSAG